MTDCCWAATRSCMRAGAHVCALMYVVCRLSVCLSACDDVVVVVVVVVIVGVVVAVVDLAARYEGTTVKPFGTRRSRCRSRSVRTHASVTSRTAPFVFVFRACLPGLLSSSCRVVTVLAGLLAGWLCTGVHPVEPTEPCIRRGLGLRVLAAQGQCMRRCVVGRRPELLQEVGVHRSNRPPTLAGWLAGWCARS